MNTVRLDATGYRLAIHKCQKSTIYDADVHVLWRYYVAYTRAAHVSPGLFAIRITKVSPPNELSIFPPKGQISQKQEKVA